jgi:type I restriction enzyme M protein
VKDITELQKNRSITPNSWIIKVEDIKDYNLSAKNPNKAKEEVLPSPIEILTIIEQRNEKINKLTKELSIILSK